MNASDVITLGQDALLMGALIAGPLLLGILVVGVLIGIVQAATSVQEMTLSFIPKLIILVLLLFFLISSLSQCGILDFSNAPNTAAAPGFNFCTLPPLSKNFFIIASRSSCDILGLASLS